MAKQVRRLVTSAVLVPLVVMAVLSGLLAWEVRLLLREAAWVDHTDTVLAQSNRTMRLILDMESSARGYLITRDRRFIDAYRVADAQVVPAMEQLSAAVDGDAEQGARMQAVRDLFARWRELAEPALDERTAQEAARAGALARKERMDEMRGALGALLDAEETRRHDREAAVRRTTTLTGLTALAVLVLVAAILFLVTRKNLTSVADHFEEALAGERAARSSAEEALRVREAFVHMASHELKTPLTSLQLQIESLLRQLGKLEVPPAGVDRLENKGRAALRQLARLQQLVAALLDVQRLTATGTEPVVTDVDAIVVVREAIAQIDHEMRNSGCTLTLDAPHALFVRADAMRLGQVLTNLLTNAMKYGRGRPITVTLTQAGPRGIIRVRDQGIGISPEDQARIFERFERAVSPEHFHGFGLGLWIVKTLVDKMDGTVRVESEPGHGATFIVDLPIGEGEALDVTGEHTRSGLSRAAHAHASLTKHERTH